MSDPNLGVQCSFDEGFLHMREFLLEMFMVSPFENVVVPPTSPLVGLVSNKVSVQ